MNWQTFFESPLAVWIPVIVLVALIIFAFRKQIGGLIDRLTSGNVEAGAEGVKVKIEAPAAPAQPATPAPTPPAAAPAQPATTTAAEPPHHYGAVITNAKSTAGGALAEDQTGQGALIDHVEVKDDLIASSAPPPASDPKAKSPA